MNEMAHLLTLLAIQAQQKKLITPSELEPILHKGLNCRALDRVRDALGITTAELCACIGLPERAIDDARQKKQTIGANESDRLFRIAELIARATALFGTQAKAARWITTPQAALGEETPLSKLRTGVGVDRVKEILAAIQYGVYV